MNDKTLFDLFTEIETHCHAVNSLLAVTIQACESTVSVADNNDFANACQIMLDFSERILKAHSVLLERVCKLEKDSNFLVGISRAEGLQRIDLPTK